MYVNLKCKSFHVGLFGESWSSKEMAGGCGFCLAIATIFWWFVFQVSKDVPAETLQSFVAHIMEKAPGKTLALVVVGLEKYFRLKLRLTALFQRSLCVNPSVVLFI